MSLDSRGSASLLFGAAHATAIFLAPVAASEPAEPVKPVAGTQSPGTTVNALKNLGYKVIVQWVRGKPNVVPLSQCVVTDINTVVETRAYVSVSCPPADSQ